MIQKKDHKRYVTCSYDFKYFGSHKTENSHDDAHLLSCFCIIYTVLFHVIKVKLDTHCVILNSPL